MNPWLVNPPWMHYSSAVREAAIAETETDDFLKCHHKTAALYFGISFIEAFLNRKMRQVMEARGEPETEIIDVLRKSSKFREKLKNWPELISGKKAVISVNLQDKLVAINEVRGDITHAKSSGIYEKLETTNAASFLDSLAEYAVQFHSSMGETFPYWLTGWNYVNPQQSSPAPWIINDQQFIHSLAYFGLRIDSFDAKASGAWRLSHMSDVAGYHRLKKMMDTFEPCEPIDPEFPFRPRLCRRWWDIEHIKANSRKCIPQRQVYAVGQTTHAGMFLSPLYIRKDRAE